ncbi:MAG: hypothetical protein ACI9OU_000933 [Candidatus Promineifilaceae bacterium]|jgi:hypothetical protein
MGGQIKGRAFVYEVALRGLLQFVVKREEKAGGARRPPGGYFGRFAANGLKLSSFGARRAPPVRYNLCRCSQIPSC